MGGGPDDGQSLNEYRLLMRHVLYVVDLTVRVERFHERGYTPSVMIRKYCTNVLLLLFLTKKDVVDHNQ